MNAPLRRISVEMDAMIRAQQLEMSRLYARNVKYTEASRDIAVRMKRTPSNNFTIGWF